jgi:chemotaxis-related protein WspB
MLFLVIYVGEDRYAIDASQALEVLPLVCWKHLAGAPAGVAGVFNFHGTPVPLIDLSELMTGTPSRSWMSTRIIVVNRNAISGDGARLLGLLAERVTDTLRVSEGDFRHSAMTGDDTPYLGPIAIRPDGMIQRLNIENLLPADVQSRLFPAEASTA